MSNPDSSLSKDPSNMDVLVNRAESYTKAKPTKALSAAFGLGIIMALFPMGRVIGFVLRLVFALLRPVLLILGVVRVYEEYNSRTRSSAEAREDS